MQPARRGGTAAGLVAAGLFFLSNYVYHITLLARVNALTALLGLSGVLLLGGRSPRRLSFGIPCLLGALFTKPTAIDAAAASLLALALVAPRRAALVAAAVLVIGCGLALVLELGSSGAFSLNVLFGNVNPFIVGQLWDYLGNFVLLHGVMLALTAVALVSAARERRVDAVQLFFLTGLVMALGVGKWGAGESYFLSAIVQEAYLRAARQAA